MAACSTFCKRFPAVGVGNPPTGEGFQLVGSFTDPHLPDGFAYRDGLISPDEEGALVERFASLPFQPFEFHGYLGKRRIVSFGWRYDYGERALRESAAIPPFLLPLRAAAAAFASPIPLENAFKRQRPSPTVWASGAPLTVERKISRRAAAP